MPFHSIEQPHSGVETPEKVAALVKEISELLAKEAVTVVPQEQRNRRLYSPYFLVPKKTGGKRPILDLRTQRERSPTAFPNAHNKTYWNVFTTETCVSMCRYFRVTGSVYFAFQGVVYGYARMPFGYALAPRTFSKCVEAALEPLHRHGIRLLAYLDDLLVLDPSAELAITHPRQ